MSRIDEEEVIFDDGQEIHLLHELVVGDEEADADRNRNENGHEQKYEVTAAFEST